MGFRVDIERQNGRGSEFYPCASPATLSTIVLAGRSGSAHATQRPVWGGLFGIAWAFVRGRLCMGNYLSRKVRQKAFRAIEIARLVCGVEGVWCCLGASTAAHAVFAVFWAFGLFYRFGFCLGGICAGLCGCSGCVVFLKDFLQGITDGHRNYLEGKGWVW